VIYQQKNRIKLLVCISSIFISTIINAQICDFHGNVIEIEGQETPNIFNTNSTLEYVNEILMINKNEMIIDDLTEQDFTSRIELENLLGCSFSIGKDFYSSLSGNIKEFDLDAIANGNNIQKLDYISFNQYGRDFKFVLVNRAYLFEFVNAISNILKPATYYEENEILAESYEYVPQTEISGEFTLIKEAEYEIVTEQVLVSDAFTELTLVGAQFQNNYHYYYNETSNCPDAIIENVPVEFITKEESITYELIGPEMETVTELILDNHAYFGPAYYKREAINLDTLKQIYVKRLEIDSMKEGCYNLNFITCSNFSEIKDSTISVSEIGLAYLPCLENYKSAGEYCYNEEIEVPATYKSRQYLKLVAPAIANTIIIDAEYTTVLTSKVINKDEIDVSCIITNLDSIKYKKLVEPPIIETQEVLAEYGTISRPLLIEYPEFDAEESNEEIQTIMIDADQNIKLINNQLKLQSVDLTCMHETIKNRLIELSFANINDELFSKEYYQAIIEYQQEKSLPIGAIDENLLESLNISFE
jgi:hypothetical protein